MAIEIREIIIRATVAAEGKEEAASTLAPRGCSNEQIVAECVETVLDVLRRKEER
jgi:hypothetical protein